MDQLFLSLNTVELAIILDICLRDSHLERRVGEMLVLHEFVDLFGVKVEETKKLARQEPLPLLPSDIGAGPWYNRRFVHRILIRLELNLWGLLVSHLTTRVATAFLSDLWLRCL